jgi:hypothetical protein
MSFEPGKLEATYWWKKEKLISPEILRSLSTMEIGGVTTYRIDGQDVTKEKYDELHSKSQEKEVITLPPIDRQVVFIDGYAGKETLNNLVALTDIASRFPEKTFVAAGGNPTWLKGRHVPDIREARKKLADRGLWPDNLIIVGFDGQYNGDYMGVKGPGCLGADIYVNWKDLEALGFDQASSFATPVITEVVSRLKAKGVIDWKQVLLNELTQKKSGLDFTGGGEVEYKVLNLEAAKEKIR